MKKKVKIYVLLLSSRFPAYHPKAGQPTGFEDAFRRGRQRGRCREQHECIGCGECVGRIKKHTIRGNADFWEHRAQTVNKGEAIISLRQWSGKPYASPQIEIGQLTTLHVQRVTLGISADDRQEPFAYVDSNGTTKAVTVSRLAANDTLEPTDFVSWFQLHRRKEPYHGVILHFTDMRY